MEASICAFCGERRELKQSHIIPKFVFRWLKDTGGTGYLRQSEAPLRRVQDGLKIQLLCEECEKRFNVWETAFANKIFHPFHLDAKVSVPYSEWFAKFCASVSWRILEYYRQRGLLEKVDESIASAVHSALDTWRRFLAGELSNPGQHEQHMLPMPGIESSTVPSLSNNINRYMLRGVEMDFVVGGDSAMVAAKMGPFHLFGYVLRPKDRWRGSRVAVASGCFGPTQYVLPMALMDYMNERASNSAQVVSNLPEHQVSKIENEILKNPEKFRSTGLFEAMLMDAEMFGLNAVIRE